MFQQRHDELHHPEVHGMGQWEHAMHCLLHLNKVNGPIGNLADKLDHESEQFMSGPIVADLVERRIPDLILVALKLHTVFGLGAEQAFFNRMRLVETMRMAKGQGYTDVPERACLRALQDYQAAHDQAFHAEVVGWKWRKRVKHISSHITKVCGILADWCDKTFHGEAASETLADLTTKRLPDLVIYVLILSYMFRVDLAEAYYRRIKDVERMGIK